MQLYMVYVNDAISNTLLNVSMLELVVSSLYGSDLINVRKNFLTKVSFLWHYFILSGKNDNLYIDYYYA